MGEEILLHATTSGRLSPDKLILMPNRLHGRGSLPIARAPGGSPRAPPRSRTRPRPRPRDPRRGSPKGWPVAVGQRQPRGGRPRPSCLRRRRRQRAARAIVGPLRAPLAVGSAPRLLERYAAVATPTLLLWAERDNLHPIEPAREALDSADADLRVLPDTGFLIAYDDAVGVAREIAASSSSHRLTAMTTTDQQPQLGAGRRPRRSPTSRSRVSTCRCP